MKTAGGQFDRSSVRRILLLVTDLEIGGTPTVVRELALRLCEPEAVQIEVACLKQWGPVADQIKASGINVNALEASRAWQLPATVRRLRELITERSIDTVVSFLVHANAVSAMALLKLPGVRFFQSIQTAQPWPGWHWRVQRMAQASAERIVVPSGAVAQVATERCGVEPSRIAVIPNAIEPAQFPRVAVFQGRTVRIGFLGRLDRVKNIPALMEAMARLKDKPHVECHIFGDGPQRTHLEQLIGQMQLSERVFLRGLVARPQDALAQMDMLVLPSGYEGFGLVLIEAMAAGVPVIAANRGGLLDVVQNGANGLLVDYGRCGWEIPACVCKLIDDADLRERLIQAGLRTVREKFTWEAVLPQYRKLLELDRRPGPVAPAQTGG